MPLESQIEAVLFWKAEPIKISGLAQILERPDEEISNALKVLEKNLEGRGVQLIFKDDAVMIGTRSELSALIEKLIKEDLVRDLGKAGLETLSIVMYQGPVSRRDIDHVRGVNSSFILRNLLVRGLVERIENHDGNRGYSYRPTFELLSYLGIGRIEDLPEYEAVRAEIKERAEALVEKTKEPSDTTVEQKEE